MKNSMHFEGTVWDLVRACNSENDPLLPDKLYFFCIQQAGAYLFHSNQRTGITQR
jgi:hypothetical protein